jgi:hypothetical protein
MDGWGSCGSWLGLRSELVGRMPWGTGSNANDHDEASAGAAVRRVLQYSTRNLNARPYKVGPGRGCTGRGFGREVRWSTSGKMADIQG